MELVSYSIELSNNLVPEPNVEGTNMYFVRQHYSPTVLEGELHNIFNTEHDYYYQYTNVIKMSNKILYRNDTEMDTM